MFAHVMLKYNPYVTPCLHYPAQVLHKSCNRICNFTHIISIYYQYEYILQSTTFARSGEYLTMRIRQQTFDSYLRQEIAYYDNPKNNTGALCTRLSTDAAAVQGVS